MKLLEAELRSPLFERAHRPVTLTEAGAVLLERAEQILHELRSTREELHAFAGLERGHVRVGTLPAHGAGWTVPMLGGFHRQFPHIDLDLDEGTSAVLLDLLLNRTLDVACMNVPSDNWNVPSGVSLAPIHEFELFFAVARGHHLWNRKRVPLAEIADEPLILAPSSGVSWILEHAFATRGLQHRVRFEIEDQHTRLELVAEGLGVAVSTRTGIAQYPELPVRAVQPADAQLKGNGVVAWTERGIRNRAVRALVQFARVWAETPHTPGPR